jgi:hypothetical protein
MCHKAYLAPRPGLEPGTYGLTVFRSRRMPNSIRFSKLPKLLIFLEFFHLVDFGHSMRFPAFCVIFSARLHRNYTGIWLACWEMWA